MIFLRSTLFNICFFGFTFIACFLYLPTLLLPRRIFIKTLDGYFLFLHILEKTILNLDYEIKGRENLPKNGSYIIASKHYSTYETMKIPLIFEDISIILKRELMWIPLWGWFAAKAKMIPVNRGSRDKAIESIKNGAQKMRNTGRPILIFPQGTRVGIHDTPTEKPYKHGVAHIAMDTGLPVIPLAINSGVFWPRKAWNKKPGVVTFEFGPPISPEGRKSAILEKIETELESRSDKLVQKALHQQGKNLKRARET